MSVVISRTIVCPECNFATRDAKLYEHHSCDVQKFGGHCEDYPCCGHENGDCNGQLYGSDEAIKEYAMEHSMCDHENGVFECYDEDEEDDEDG